jgi:hypothetical protein
MAKRERYEVKNAQGYSHQLLFTSDDLLEAKAFIAQYGKKANITDRHAFPHKVVYRNY